MAPENPPCSTRSPGRCSGKARGKSSDVINLHKDVKAAEVAITFEHEGNTYRVQRTLPRNKSTILEFQVKTQDGWRPLTEKTTRDTQVRIEQTLRLDYDTFVNASFFLQGKADQFTQQNPGKRKEVLSNILGLEMWEEYKNRSAERRKLIEREVDGIEARISEIDAELAEEETRKTRLAELESTLVQLTATRTAQEAVLEIDQDDRRSPGGTAQARGNVERIAGTLPLASLRVADSSHRPGSGPRLVCRPRQPRR